MLFADSCRKIAMSYAELQRMARVLDELLQDAGFRIVLQEAVWCCSTTDTLDATITVTDIENTRRSREHSQKALEVCMTFDGHS